MFGEVLLILGVLSALFAMAVYCVARVRTLYQQETAAAQEAVVLSIGAKPVEIERERHVTWQERYLDAVPGVVLVVGLFGTFVGLAISIDAAGDVLRQGGHGIEDLQRQFDALSRAVNGISVKFLSSLVGIGMHLASRLLIGVFVAPAHGSLMKARQRARDVARAEVHRRRTVVEHELVESISQIRDRIEGIATLPDAAHEQLDALAQIAKSNKDLIQKLELTARHASEMAVSLEQTLRQTSVIASKFELAANTSGATVVRLHESVQTMRDSVASQSSTSRELIAATAMMSERSNAALTERTNYLASVIDQFGRQLDLHVSGFDAALNEHAKAVGSSLEQHMKELKRGAARGSSSKSSPTAEGGVATSDPRTRRPRAQTGLASPEPATSTERSATLITPK